MPTVNDADRQLLDEAADLPGALYGARIYSMTALLALAQQREAFERELASMQARRRHSQGGIGGLDRLVARRKGAVALLIGVLLTATTLLLMPTRHPDAPPPSPAATPSSCTRSPAVACCAGSSTPHP